MHRCPCGYEAKSAAGLSAHRRSRHQSRNAASLMVTLDQLEEMGRIERVDAARVQGLMSMAESLDIDPSNAALWRQYREALRELTADDSGGSLDDDLAALYSEVRNSPEA